MAPKNKRVQPRKAVDKSNTNATSPTTTSSAADPNSDTFDSGFRGNGILASCKTSFDIKIEEFTLHAYGGTLIHDSAFELTRGQRYGLIGRNGSGKSTWLKSLAARDVPIPTFVDIYLLENEAPKESCTALEYCVREARLAMEKIEQEVVDVMELEGAESETLTLLYAKLEAINPNTFEQEASQVLYGLGFTPPMLKKATADMSGGWRMRVSLAKALFIKPDLLLLDEPTNHLDLEACVWLEEYLSCWDRCLIVNSHSQAFLNAVTTMTINITAKKTLHTYTGNYESFLQTKGELEVNQMKQFKKEQDDIKHLKKFITSCGTYANLVRQAKSKQKILDKMEEKGLTEEIKEERAFSFKFLDCEKLPPPVIDVVGLSFAYPNSPQLYKGLNLAVHSDSRIALVGPNGAGKSTLLKLIAGQLTATDGEVKRHSHVRFGFFSQHIEDVISPREIPLDFMIKTFGEGKMEEQVWRTALGRFGVSGSLQTTEIGKMSDGQKRRLLFSYLAHTKPNMLLLDEPTNHLDMDTIDALANAIKEFNGGMVLVSHDFRLIEQVCEEVWLCDDKTVSPVRGGIRAYRETLVKKYRKKNK
eukprot:GHVR01094685.1.p1 GENE.GHVR01094685.1~~GHVR01094685.1.p1  ORF type:complete len:588 (+),score=129.68 GHVR01094685.1:77-1840(+)